MELNQSRSTAAHMICNVEPLTTDEEEEAEVCAMLELPLQAAYRGGLVDYQPLTPERRYWPPVVIRSLRTSPR